ncbi:hypothetical protein DM860_017965 [Cuscuta australis]|uniref:cytokinin riboside 5'-monophosphate phosphoribohydrolase n=1 Tax=Cuscuta australis TaxID=267555 RepID=A0A328DWF3_9ASTE|nr:hypothetical protein DM860_017965 [Cuscuta australis]
MARMEKMMMEYIQKMNNLADDLKERDKMRDNQLQQVFKQLGVREQANLPATTEQNPREQLRVVTLRSGKELQGQEVEANVEEVPVDTFPLKNAAASSEGRGKNTTREAAGTKDLNCRGVDEGEEDIAELLLRRNRLSGGGGAVRTVSLIGTNFWFQSGRRISLAYGGGNVGLQGAVASTVFTNGGLVRGFIPGYIATRRVYGPTYGVEHTVSSNYYKYFEMNHAVEAFIILPGGVDTMEGLFTLISWASEGLHNRPIGLLNIDGYFNNLLKFLDDAVRQNFMASSQRKPFISSFFVDKLLDKLEFAKAFPGPGVSYDEFVNPGRLDLELHL